MSDYLERAQIARQSKLRIRAEYSLHGDRFAGRRDSGPTIGNTPAASESERRPAA